MTLLNPEQVGVSAAQLQTAEALVAAAIGASSLAAREATQTGTFAGGVIALRDGPATEILSFSLNGYPMQPSYGPWWLDMGLGTRLPNPVMGGYGAGVYAVAYRAGWTAENLPEPIQQAITLTAQGVAAVEATGGLKEYRVGDVTKVYAAPPAPTGIPIAAAAMLTPYLPLRF